MSNSQKLSRRDWFRLRIPRENQMLSDDDAPVEKNVLQAIEQPPNHDGLDLSKLPPMREAILSTEQVNSLFADIELFGADVLLMQRSSGAERASVAKPETAVQLNTAQSSLLDGRVKRLQIRYRWKDALWIDTLESNPAGFRLVRIQHRSA